MLGDETLYYTVPTVSKIHAFYALVQESVCSTVTKEEIIAAAEEGFRELLQEKAKLLESNKNLTEIALEMAAELEGK
jgi:hypothetical protein